ncbi:hypothetical protein EIN_106540, partial [Entamoeba invadens IP1]
MLPCYRFQQPFMPIYPCNYSICQQYQQQLPFMQLYPYQPHFYNLPNQHIGSTEQHLQLTNIPLTSFTQNVTNDINTNNYLKLLTKIKLLNSKISGRKIPIIDDFVFHRTGRSFLNYKFKDIHCDVSIKIVEFDGPINNITTFKSYIFTSYNQIHSHQSHDAEAKNEAKERLIETASLIEKRFVSSSKALEDKDFSMYSKRESTTLREFRRLRQKMFTNCDFKSHPLYNDYLIKEDPDFAVFVNKNKVNKINDFELLFMDGTFSTAPKIFYQMYTINCMLKNGEHFTLVHALLVGKTESLFKKCLIVLMITGKITMGMFYSKMAVQNALEYFGCITKGCYFHLCQSLWRKVNTLGLSSRFKEDQQFYNIVKSLMCLAFLPVEDVSGVFENMKKDCTDLELLKVYNYYEQTWLGNVFPKEMWNQYCCKTRTNNICESFHSVFAKRLEHKHPSEVEWLDKIIKIETKENEQFKNMLDGVFKRKRSQNVSRNTLIENLTYNFTNKLITTQQFISKLCNINYLLRSSYFEMVPQNENKINELIKTPITQPTELDVEKDNRVCIDNEKIKHVIEDVTNIDIKNCEVMDCCNESMIPLVLKT